MFVLVFLLLLGQPIVQADVVGVAPEDQVRYGASTFICDGGTVKLPQSAVNDDYCDCADGSDEPGTPACPNSKFHCLNREFIASRIASAFVNDGICDCCDGSDEQSTHECPNTCPDLAAQYQAKAIVYEAKQLQGYNIKMDMIASAPIKRAEGPDQMAAIGRQMAPMEKRIGQLRAKAKVEEEARIEREKTEIKSETTGESDDDMVFSESESNTPPGETTESPHQDEQMLAEEPWLSGQTDYFGMLYKAAVDWLISGPGFLKATGDWVASFWIAWPSVKKGKLTAAEELEQALEQANALKSKYRALQLMQMVDMGPAMEFLYMVGQCYTVNEESFEYKLCPFDRVEQNPGDILLGQHFQWSGKEDLYSAMTYTHGTPCWQGPVRSTTVTLECGTVTELHNITEHPKCTYQMTLTTPAACYRPSEADLRGETWRDLPMDALDSV